MDTVHPDRDPIRQAYIVRIWRSKTDGQWRISVQNVATTERQDFANLEALFLYFRQQIGDTAVNSRDPPQGKDSD
ncbi:MAG: hypothetical protein DWQ04_13810 [Chloroflexi bacterium]|nr:MAG: hypothetical protein DWQ04_13810 [Chloroflexota bacterium]